MSRCELKFRAHENEQCTIQLPNRTIESSIYNYFTRSNFKLMQADVYI